MLPFYILNVFVQEKHTNSGNQLAIFLPTTELAPEKCNQLPMTCSFLNHFSLLR